MDEILNLIESVSEGFLSYSLNEFCNLWCKREHVECYALKDWKLNVFKIMDRRISFILKILTCYHVNLRLVIVI